ncbi:MAG: MOFRL family protein, partial [Bdellovibrionota bacterium]|nr:MOFRL family protein [Bdellovibrionota bacterium]
YLTGGETPVLVKGKGLGGRNTEFVLRMAKELFFDNVLGLSEIVLKRIAVASFATDGTDGETSSAGAWFDYSSFLKAKLSGLEVESYLRGNDSYNYFKKLGGLISIEKGEVNIMDLRIVLLKG